MITNHPYEDFGIEYKLEVERMINEGGGVFEELHIRMGASLSAEKKLKQESE